MVSCEYTDADRGNMLSKRPLKGLFQQLRADPLASKRLDDAANSLMRVIRNQLKRDAIMSHDELKAYLFTPVTQMEDNIKLVQAIQNAAKALHDFI
jgi:hypothetical protein